MKVVIGGANGFIGSELARECASDGHEVVVLVRGDKPVVNTRSVQWDGETLSDWATEVDGADVVVNLSGEPISQKWSDDNKRRITDSRLNSTRAIRQAIESAKRPPKAFLCGSAVGYYGDTGDQETDESSPKGTGFLAELCEAWEQESKTAKTRVVNLRTGVVLGKEGGMLPTLASLTKAFFGGQVGEGKQYIPWIHIEDYIRLVRWCGLGTVSGPINLCAPRPVSNADLMATLRKVAHRPWAPPAPAAAVKAFGVIGPDPSLLLMSIRAIPGVAMARGFTFRWPDLEAALRDLV